MLLKMVSWISTQNSPKSKMSKTFMIVTSEYILARIASSNKTHFYKINALLKIIKLALNNCDESPLFLT